MARTSKSVQPSASKTVKLSIPISVADHARLCALAALQTRDRSIVAAEILASGLRHVVIQTRGAGDDGEEGEGRPAPKIANL